VANRVGRRRSKVHRLALLTPWRRWALVDGNKGGAAFDSPEQWDEAYRLHRDALLAEPDDPAESFRAFWLYDESVPDELLADLRRAGGVLLPPDEAAAYERRYADLLERRRAWLKRHGYR
jgi:hypothetical protein